MHDINLNLYKVFYYVASLKSFNDAADKLYISQPAVSKQIKNLEELLDVKLFNRYNKGIELTNEGKILFEQVEKMFSCIDVSNKNLSLAKQLLIGEITIGCPSHITSFYLLNYIEKFKKEHPQIIVKIDSSSTAELIYKLQKHQIDFIIDSLPIEVDKNLFKMIPLRTFETTFIINSNSKIDKTDDLSKQCFILPPEKSSMRRSLDKVLKKNNINLNVGLLVETTDLIINAVKNNIGIGYVIKDAGIKDLNDGIFKEIKFDFELPVLEINLIYSEDFISYPVKIFLKEYIKAI